MTSFALVNKSMVFRMMFLLSVFLICLLGLTSGAKEPRTGIEFPDKYKRSPLVKLGLRTKGPIKVYAVGQYGKNQFMLKMNYNVGAEKLSGALMDALKPRCLADTCADKIEEFHKLLLDALPNGAKQGMQLVFDTGGKKLSVRVDDKSLGSVSSKDLASAFAGIYTDDKAVCKMIPVVDQPPEEEEESLGLEVGSIVAVFCITVTSVLFWIFKNHQQNSTKTRQSGTAAYYVSELNVYPIKSCAAQRVLHAHATPRGLEGDRIAQVTDSEGTYCTPRDEDKARLFHVKPRFLHENLLTVSAPDMDNPLVIDLQNAPTNPVMVEVLDAPERLQLQDYGAAAGAWMEKATGIPKCRLTGTGSDFDRSVLVNPAQGDKIPTASGKAQMSLADEAPYLLTSLSSLEDLNHRMRQRGKKPVDMRRFRPNIVMDGLQPWEEDSLKKIRIGGSVDFWVWQRCGRCTMTTIDRDTLARSSEPLRTLNTFRERNHGTRNFGMHLIPCEGMSSDATISVGDSVEILEYDEERRSEWKRLFGEKALNQEIL